MKLLVATHNPGKAQELKQSLQGLNLEVLSLNDLNLKDDVEKTGDTFKANALLKARYYCQLADLPTLADDSGLEIHALNNEPGVKSRRWKGYSMSDQELIDYALERLKGIPLQKRTANFSVCLALVFPDKKEYTTEAKSYGLILEKQQTPITPGYPFRSIFLSTESNTKLHHRQQALEKLKRYLLN